MKMVGAVFPFRRLMGWRPGEKTSAAGKGATALLDIQEGFEGAQAAVQHGGRGAATPSFAGGATG
jgi:hypothetical protein